MKVDGLLGHDQFADDLFGRDDPSQAQARRQKLREGAQVDDIPTVTPAVLAAELAIERDERRDVVAFEAQLPVGVVFDDGHAVFIG